MANQNKKIVVVGGGSAGHSLAYQIQSLSNVEVVLIDPKDYFEVPLAVPRLLVEPDKLPAQIKYSEFLPKVKLVQGFAAGVDDVKKIVTVNPTGEGGEGKQEPIQVPYDYLVLATGSSYRGGLIKTEKPNLKDRQAQLREAHHAIAEAKHIVVVGSGAVGVEVVGEIVHAFPKKPITVVDSNPKINFGPKEFPEWIMDFYNQHGVKTEFGSRVANPALGTLKTDRVVLENGKVIEADVVIWSAGIVPNTNFLRANFADQITERGLVKVNPNLQVPNHPNIFVVGDITDLPEVKVAFLAKGHVKTVIKNLTTLLKKGDKAALEAYKPNPPDTAFGGMMLLTLGPTGGLASLPLFGARRADWLVRNLKAKDMFVGNYRGEVGLKKA